MTQALLHYHCFLDHQFVLDHQLVQVIQLVLLDQDLRWHQAIQLLLFDPVNLMFLMVLDFLQDQCHPVILDHQHFLPVLVNRLDQLVQQVQHFHLVLVVLLIPLDLVFLVDQLVHCCPCLPPVPLVLVLLGFRLVRLVQGFLFVQVIQPDQDFQQPLGLQMVQLVRCLLVVLEVLMILVHQQILPVLLVHLDPFVLVIQVLHYFPEVLGIQLVLVNQLVLVSQPTQDFLLTQADHYHLALL